MIPKELFEACGLEANLAPSVHNVQPARWALQPGGRIALACAVDTALAIADPDASDLLFSCGTALEGSADWARTNDRLSPVRERACRCG